MPRVFDWEIMQIVMPLQQKNFGFMRKIMWLNCGLTDCTELCVTEYSVIRTDENYVINGV